MDHFVRNGTMSLPKQSAILLSLQEPSSSERNMGQLLDFFGVASRKVLNSDQNALGAPPQGIGCGQYSVLSSAVCLVDTLEHYTSTTLLPPLLTSAGSLYIYGFDETEASKKLLRLLTGDPQANIRCSHLTQSRISVTSDLPEICGPMSGISVSGLTLDSRLVFEVARNCKDCQSLIATSDGDIFLKALRWGLPIFISAGGANLDIETPVKGNFFDIKDYFCAAVPPVIYLKWAFRDVCWTNSAINASLIVDDPLLKPRYGCLVYRDVLDLMNQHHFSTTIAFIPWNWRKTNATIAHLFQQHPDQLSLAIHGCDHTSHEFGTQSISVLNDKIKTAKRRMDVHRQRTSVPYAPIMVFPQGVFSPESAQVLKFNNFTAAVNTEVTPCGGLANTTVSELWNTAIMQYFDFPIFSRRYITHGLENFAFDALLGKPCLIVAHHDSFRDQSRDLTTFLAGINGLKCSLSWRSLGDTLQRSFRSRDNGDGTTSVQMFSHAIIVENSTSAPHTFLIAKKECNPAGVRAVIHDQSPLDWTYDGGWLQFQVYVPPKAATHVRVEYADIFGDHLPANSLSYKAKAGLRRWLSEVRDNYGYRTDFLYRLRTKRWHL
jgi:hypothetical protein